jgi:hypothetical protein
MSDKEIKQAKIVARSMKMPLSTALRTVILEKYESNKVAKRAKAND